MAVSKRLRYEILRRDNHQCRYCGATAPDVKLTVDHVVPTTLGGSDDPTNLVAACADCNAGKTSSSPDAPLVADVEADAFRWGRAMTEAANMRRRVVAIQAERHEDFDLVWQSYRFGFHKVPCPLPHDWRRSLDIFFDNGLDLDDIWHCLDVAMQSKVSVDQTWKYFCGVVWTEIRERQLLAASIVDVIDLPDPFGGGPDGE